MFKTVAENRQDRQEEDNKSFAEKYSNVFYRLSLKNVVRLFSPDFHGDAKVILSSDTTLLS